jgi:23S rRNA maturation mini-RNase III
MTTHADEVREHMLTFKTDRSQYGRVYFVSQRTGATMSEVLRVCIDEGLMAAEQKLMRKAKNAKKSV